MCTQSVWVSSRIDTQFTSHDWNWCIPRTDARLTDGVSLKVYKKYRFFFLYIGLIQRYLFSIYFYERQIHLLESGKNLFRVFSDSCINRVKLTTNGQENLVQVLLV
jgi:hypothetical protein